MGRSIYCSTCKKEKEPGRDNESRCFKCKSDAYKANRLKKRLAKGLRPMGSGRNPVCRCGQAKENPKLAYCYSCKRKEDNEWRLKTGRTLRHRTGKCKCGKEFASYSGYQCVDCYRERRKKEKYKPEYAEKWIKEKVRSFTRGLIRRGILVRQPCEICNTNENVEAHHDDYAKPMDIRWLCFEHHREHHKSIKDE